MGKAEERAMALKRLPKKPSAHRTTSRRSTNKRQRKTPRHRNVEALGPEILWHYPGKHIIYSEDQKRVIGVRDTEEEAYARAKASGVGGLWHHAYADTPGEYSM
jgi:hypothetical protein